MLLGPGCSVVSTFVGQAAKMWNLIVVSLPQSVTCYVTCGWGMQGWRGWGMQGWRGWGIEGGGGTAILNIQL